MTIKKPIKLQSTLYLNREECDDVIHSIIINKVINVICTGLAYRKGKNNYELTIYMEVVN